MRRMLENERFAIVIALLVLLLGSSALVAGEVRVCSESLQGRSELEETPWFTATSSTRLTAKPGYDWEIVTTEQGQFVRFGQVQGDFMFVQATLECKCTQFICGGDCVIQNSGGSATCRGGCYKPGGEPCRSCEFVVVQPQNQ